MNKITISDWMMITAVILGPILAVQVQKLIEHWKEKRGRKVRIFKTLMATRATFLSPQHIEALNMIDLEFYKNMKIREAWKLYLDQLNEPQPEPSNPNFEVLLSTWGDKSNEYFMNLLHEMAKSLGYNFDKVQLKKGAYYPRGHVDLESQQKYIRTSIIDLFLGRKTLPITIQSQEPSAKQ